MVEFFPDGHVAIMDSLKKQPTFRDVTTGFSALYYYMRNFCNLIGLEQWYFSLIWNTYMWKLQNLCG